MNFKLGFILVLIPICTSQRDSTKWVWGDGRSGGERTRIVNGDRRYNGELANLGKPLFQANNKYSGEGQFSNIRYRYEVTETPYPSDYTTYRPRPPEQYRPDLVSNKPVGSYRPPPEYYRPDLDNYRPITRPHENEYRPLGNGYRPPNGDYSLHGLRPGVGTNGRPILTGPTPSWEEHGHHKYKDYDICKCVHSFNCNTPGIKFGTCDTDKQYCCYKSKQNEGHENIGKPITNIYERPRPRPVLAGPGGPVDPQNKVTPVRPYVDKYDPDRELNEAYKKGLSSAISEVYQRPNAYKDRDFSGYRELNEAYKKGLSSAISELQQRPNAYRPYYQSDRDYYQSGDTFKSSHPSKYGLYDPSASLYARSGNSTISAISDAKN